MSQHTSAEVLPLLPSDNGEAQTITFYLQWTKQDWKVRRKCEVGSFWRSLGFHYFSALISASHKNNSAQLWTCLCREFDWEEPNAFRSRPLMAIEAERERCSSRSFGLDSGSELHRENTSLFPPQPSNYPVIPSLKLSPTCCCYDKKLKQDTGTAMNVHKASFQHWTGNSLCNKER